jgi:hypothetical protein
MHARFLSLFINIIGRVRKIVPIAVAQYGMIPDSNSLFKFKHFNKFKFVGKEKK